jgi:hypothetical protein
MHIPEREGYWPSEGQGASSRNGHFEGPAAAGLSEAGDRRYQETFRLPEYYDRFVSAADGVSEWIRSGTKNIELALLIGDVLQPYRKFVATVNALDDDDRQNIMFAGSTGSDIVRQYHSMRHSFEEIRNTLVSDLPRRSEADTLRAQIELIDQALKTAKLYE